MHKKILALLATLVLLTTSIVIAQASDIQPRYAYIRSVSAGTRLTGSSLWCFGQGDALTADTVTYLNVIVLSQSHSGGTWSAIASWSTSANGISTALIDETISVSPGYDYKVYTNIQIRDANGYTLESKGVSSHTVSYPVP